jgi:pyridoxamine 5'-phosphate oxidase
MTDSHAPKGQPLELLKQWLEEAEEARVTVPRAMTLATVAADGRPSARMVSLKRIAGDALIFTTALWTRKVVELRDNQLAAATFYWSALGRQVRVEGRAEVAERALAEELFAERPRSHQMQAHVSRQGEEIGSLDQLRIRLEELRAELGEGRVPCPEEWGAVRLIPDRIEFWQEAEDRLHRRQLYEAGTDGWRERLLAP